MFLIESPTDSRSATRGLIAEKIEMPSPVVANPRPRLQAMLEQSLASCTSTILSGRAGTGKTTLAVDFAERSGRCIAWYKVDAPDSEPRIFLQYLVASISRQRPKFGQSTLLPLVHNTSSIHEIPRLADALLHELESKSGKPLLVIIEDLHLVCDADWLVPFFRRLLPLLPSDVHLLITSRTLPPAPLWRMRSKQTLSVIDEETLSFTRDEAVSLFESYGLSREQATIALDHSHGRAASLASLAATLHFIDSQTTQGPNTSSTIPSSSTSKATT